MTSKFEYKKVCQFCGNEFVAQKSTTKYCSASCAKRGHKEEKRQERLQIESEAIKERRRQNLLAQENLSLTDAAALLFSCLTGLRFSDILALRWENFETYPDGGHCIRLRTEKTDAEALNPISQEVRHEIRRIGFQRV